MAYCIQRILGAAVLALAPAAFAQPVVSVESPEHSAAPGTPAQVRYRVTWTGAADAYAVLPPRQKSAEWGNIHIARSHAHSNEDRHEVEFILEAVAPEAGDFEVPATEIPYVTKGEAPLGGALAGGAPLLLSAAAAPVRFRAPVAWGRWGALGAACAAAAAAGGAAWVRRRRPAAAAGRGPREAAQEALHAARRRRLDGDYYGFYKGLTEAAEGLGLDEARGLAERTQAVGYRGVRPTDDEMDGDAKRVELGLRRAQAQGPEQEGVRA